MLDCIRVLKDSVKISLNDNTASWSATEDLLCGDAGTGLFLLYAFEHTQDSSLFYLAVKTGNGLVKKGNENENKQYQRVTKMKMKSNENEKKQYQKGMKIRRKSTK